MINPLPALPVQKNQIISPLRHQTLTIQAVQAIKQQMHGQQGGSGAQMQLIKQLPVASGVSGSGMQLVKQPLTVGSAQSSATSGGVQATIISSTGSGVISTQPSAVAVTQVRCETRAHSA